MMRRLAALLFLTPVLLWGVGCATEEAEEGVDFSLSVQALETSCGATGAVPAEVAAFRVKVVQNDPTQDKPTVLLDKDFPVSSKVIKLSKVAEGEDIELTILGLEADPAKPPVQYGRVRGITVLQDETAKVAVSLSNFGKFSCMTPPNGASNVMFPTLTTLPDGRILMAGGFRKVTEDTGRFEVTMPSDMAFIYDPATNAIKQVGNMMNKPRGAHAAAYLPKSQLVLLVGGTERLYMEKKNDCFPWYFLKDKAGDVGYTYELFDTRTEKFLVWDGADWPDGTLGEDGKVAEPVHVMVKQVRRVFPAVAVNNDGTALVTGGGLWPSCQTKSETDADYQVAELYRPRTEGYEGGFMNSFGALTMKAMRSGHTATLLEVKDKLAYHIFWGGADEGAPIAEIYKESSGQLDGNFGAFSPVTWLDNDSYKKRPYFHTMTPLKDRQFLLLGGVLNSKGKLKVPSAGDAHLVKVQTDLKIGVSSVEGLGEGRYFHSATTYDNDHVVVLGGFSSVVQGENTLFSSTATDDVRFFDRVSGKLTLPPIDAAPKMRGGHVAAALGNDCILLLGGVDQVFEGLEFGNKALALLSEMYCPSMICPEKLWPTGCYVE